MRSTTAASARMSSAVSTDPVGLCGVLIIRSRVLRRDRAPDGVPVDRIVRKPQRDDDRHAAVQLDGGHVRVVARLEDDHFVAGVHARGDRAEDRLRRARSDRDLGFRIVGPSVRREVHPGDRLTQRQYARHRRILVAARAHVARHRFDQFRIAVEVGESLRQIDRPHIGREPRHHREDRRSDGWQPGRELDHAGLRSNTPRSRFFRTSFQAKC